MIRRKRHTNFTVEGYKLINRQRKVIGTDFRSVVMQKGKWFLVN